MNLNKEKNFIQQILLLAIPVALQTMLTASANMIDTMMVASVGNLAVAAAGVVGGWTIWVNQILFGLASGCSVLISQYWGIKDHDKIQETYGISMVLCFAVVSLYTFACLIAPKQLVSFFTNEPELIDLSADYMRIVSVGMLIQTYAYIASAARRATEDVRTPMIGAVISSISNVIFNWILIYGNLGMPSLGLRGAAIATSISMFIHTFFYLIIGKRQHHFTCIDIRKMLSFSRESLKKYMKTSLPVLGNDVCWGTAMAILYMIFAHQGSENYAGYTIFRSIYQFCNIFFEGICVACGIMIGKTVGSGNKKEAFHLGKRFLALVPAMGIFVGCIMLLLIKPILSLANIETAQAYMVTYRLVQFISVWLAIRNFNYVAVVGVFRAGGDTRIGFIIDTAAMLFVLICVSITAAYIKPPFIWLVLTMYFCEDIPKAISCILYFRTGKWMKKLTDA